jgi:hypothetical protein
MKKIILLASVCCFAYASNAAEHKVKAAPTSAITVPADWTKSKDNIWEGTLNGTRVWYKFDLTSGSVWCSVNSTNWDIVKDGMWQDKDGRWLKISNKALKWSKDSGNTYVDVPEGKWEGPNGTWYKFDKTWSLWSMGGKM